MKANFFKLLIGCLFLSFQSNAQIINIEDKRIHTKDSVNWYGDFSLGMSVIQAQKKILTLRGAAQIEYKKNNHLVLSISDYALLKGGSEAFENATFQHFRYNYKLKENLTWEMYAQVQQNKIQHIELRTLAGAGIRFRALKSKNRKSRAYLGTALMREYNNFKGDNEQVFFRLSNYLSAVYEPNKQMKFSTTSYFQPQIPTFDLVRLSSQNALFFRFNKHLSFRVDFNLSYDPTLPKGVNKVFYSWNNGLKWEL